MLPKLQLVQPRSIAEASKALAEFGDKAKVYAGGAEILLLMRHRLLPIEVLINVKKIGQLEQLTCDEKGLRVGACLTHHALETSALVRAHAPSFAYAESQVANIRVRSQGTLGGNLCFNDPHSDPGTVLLVYEASVTIGSRRGERQMLLDDFFLDMYSTALEADELLLEVQIPPLPGGMESVYLRLHRYQRPTLGVAAAVMMNGDTIEQTRLAVGCIGPRAQRLPDIEFKFKGATLSEAEKIVAEQKSYFRDVLRPVDDLLGSSDYKLHMTRVLVAEAVKAAAQRSDHGDR
jgi:carbon-monoxide dehydrogenase medium subunit